MAWTSKLLPRVRKAEKNQEKNFPIYTAYAVSSKDSAAVLLPSSFQAPILHIPSSSLVPTQLLPSFCPALLSGLISAEHNAQRYARSLKHKIPMNPFNRSFISSSGYSDCVCRNVSDAAPGRVGNTSRVTGAHERACSVSVINGLRFDGSLNRQRCSSSRRCGLPFT